jgi:hypothetical protein
MSRRNSNSYASSVVHCLRFLPPGLAGVVHIGSTLRSLSPWTDTVTYSFANGGIRGPIGHNARARTPAVRGLSAA